MILDTSAVFAVILDEAERFAVEGALERAEVVRVSAATLVELTSVATSRNLLAAVDAFIAEISPEVVAFDAEQAAIARDAQKRFGAGRYKLNLGDTFAYALAMHTGEPLLFKGEDFARTDVVSALGGLQA